MTENKTAAVIGAPKRKQQGFGLDKLVAQAPAAADNMKEVKEVNMTFRVDEDFHYKYKATAAATRRSMKDILIESFDLWLEKNQ